MSATLRRLSASEPPLTLAQAKQHLRVIDGGLDQEISELVAAACDLCERHTGRTLRAWAKWQQTLPRWPARCWKLPMPPLVMLGDADDPLVPAISYVDADGVEQTLDAAHYHVVHSGEAISRIEWSSTAVLPATATRPDAVRLRLTTGWGDELPPVALMAMKITLTELMGQGTEQELRAARECARYLLRDLDVTMYA